MISSVAQAPRHGPGVLVVDGTDTTVTRSATFAFKPSRAQEARLCRLLDVTREVHNAALQERRDAYATRSRTTVRLFDQFTQLTELRGVRADVFAFGLQPLCGALRTVDEAFAGFFRRVKAGETAGYPRFKAARRYRTPGPTAGHPQRHPRPARVDWWGGRGARCRPGGDSHRGDVGG